MPTRTAFLLALGLAGLPTAAVAQAPRPQPRLHRVVPTGGRAGTVVEVTVGGEAIDAADGLWFSRPGIAATRVEGKPRTFKVAIADETPVGLADVRALTPDGLTNPRTFVVGALAEVAEAEPNNTPSTAQAIAVNAVVDGTVAATDVDCFAVSGKKGQRLFLDLAAERLESRLDATIRLLDPSGVEIAESRDALGADPFLDATLPSDGRYVVKVHDVTYGGSPDHVYRLTVHDGPHLDAVFPPIAEAGRPADVILIGRNLGGKALPGRIDGHALESLAWTGRPDFLPAGSLSVESLGPAAALRGFAPRPAEPILIAESDGPVVPEREPNGPESPQAVDLPCSIGGAFGTRNDVDAYRFRAKKGEVWRIEAVAEGIGSAADPAVVLQRVADDGKGDPQDLASADDTPDPGLAPRFNLASTDASLRWTSPGDGTYQVLVGDVAGSSRGDPRLTYRLSIRRERPDFRLFVVPLAVNTLDALTVRRGGRAAAIALAWRLDGFAEPIWVLPDRLPDGLRCDPVVIPTGSVSAPIVFEADAGAKTMVETVRLLGVVAPSEAPPAVVPPPRESWAGSGRAREAIPGSLVWPPPKVQNVQATVAPSRATRGFAVAVRGGSPFLLSARATRPAVAVGGVLEVGVTVAPTPGFDDAIALSGFEPPPRWAIPAATVAKGERSASVKVPIPKNLAPGVYSLVLKGGATFAADPKLKYKVEEPSNPVVVAVRPAPASAKLPPKPATLKPGETSPIEVTVERLGKFAGPVRAVLDLPLASKLRADPLTLPPGQTTGKFALIAAADSPVGPVVGASVRLEVEVDGEALEVVEPLGLEIVKP